MDKITAIDIHLERVIQLFKDGYIDDNMYKELTQATLNILDRTTENASQTVREGELLNENGLVQPFNQDNGLVQQNGV